MRCALILLFSTLALAGCSDAGQEQTPTKDAAAPQAGEQTLAQGISTEHAGMPAPDLPLEVSPDGPSDTVADILAANPGKSVLVNLWATWCAPCIRELPSLDTLAAQMDDELLVVAISQDMEGWQKVTPFLAERSLANLHFRLESGMKYGLGTKATGLPVSILYGPDGQEKWRYVGDRDWATAESRALFAG